MTTMTSTTIFSGLVVPFAGRSASLKQPRAGPRRARATAAQHGGDEERPAPAPAPALDRRRLVTALVSAAAAAASSQEASLSTPRTAYALGFAKKRAVRQCVSAEQFREGPAGSGLSICDYETSLEEREASSKTAAIDLVAEEGDTVTVHFDVKYKVLVVASSRAAKLLNGNRAISSPYELVVGQLPAAKKLRPDGSSAPVPPKALFKAVSGMRVGDTRAVRIPKDSELGYGPDGYLEIPPNSDFELTIEMLSVEKKA